MTIHAACQRHLAAVYRRPDVQRATLTAYEANIMDALVRTAIEYGMQALMEDMREDADNGRPDHIEIAAKAGRAVFNRYRASDCERYYAKVWNEVSRRAWTERYDRAAAAAGL